MSSTTYIKDRVSTFYFSSVTFLTTQKNETKTKIVQQRDALLQRMKDGLVFVQRFIESPTTVGSVFPSSTLLAKSIVRYVDSNEEQQPNGRSILEIGPGTGSFTDEIIKKMTSSDRLDVVELDPAFCDILKKKYADRSNVKVHCLSIEDWKPEYEYDILISGLPLNSFAPEQVRKFISTFKDLTKNGGKISYFEYIGLPNVKELILNGEEKEKFKEVLSIKKLFYQTYGFKKDVVLANFPPARVLHFQIDKNDKETALD